MKPRRIVVEVAATPIRLSFRFGRLARRAPHAPDFRGAAVVEASTGETSFYALENYEALWRELRRADEVVTWNGNRFSLLVLRKFFGAGYFPIKGQHVGLSWGAHLDLCEIVEQENRLSHRATLNKVLQVTFGETMRIGRPSGSRSAQRMARCHQVTSQVLRLWRAYREGEGVALEGGPVLFHPENEVPMIS